MEIVAGLRESLARSGAEVAHLKVIGLADGPLGVANLVSSSTAPELSLASRALTNEADVIVNARVAIDPAFLERQMEVVVRSACVARSAGAEFRKTQSLRPGRPTPTHRCSRPAAH